MLNAKVKYQLFKSKLDEETYRNEVLKSNKNLCIASCSGYIENEIAETLTVYLMMNVTVKEPVQTETIQEKETLWHNFSKEEIADFSHLQEIQILFILLISLLYKGYLF
ncbi:hypothetical protein [Clostridium estertheticum]|uniref:hypothetical protein n=1 Tax=Clostridium estertheticum TaxID=238834 RepID=UPI00299E3E09|nr:hypothetical protein [Clostridium estertheticum]